MIDPLKLPDHIRPGSKFEIGSFTFEKEDVLRFANAWDPQPFHTDEEAAKNSLLGGLCASGWHTVSVWMKLQRAHLARQTEKLKRDGKEIPEFGPSPGMRNVKWIRPVYVGDCITYANEIIDIRASGSRPPWHIMRSKVQARNQHGKDVMTFNSSVFLRINQTQ